MIPLDDYEAHAIKEIAAWKDEKLSLYSRVANSVASPLANVFSRFVPRAMVVQGITTAYAASGWRVGPEPILRLGKVDSLETLRGQSLEFCDKLTGQFEVGSHAIAAVDGAVTGAGGFLLASADVMALTTIVLRAIRFTGYCYGFSLERPQDRPYILGVLMIACTRSPTERIELLGKLSNLEQWLMKGAVEAVMIEGLSRQLLKLVSLESIPGLGAVLGSTANLMFCRHVTRCSRYIFQERWLAERGKISAPIPSASSAAQGDRST